jgi:hypothetical protein
MIAKFKPYVVAVLKSDMWQGLVRIVARNESNSLAGSSSLESFLCCINHNFSPLVAERHA